MWFRVEFNRDGSIKESRQVESRGTDGGLVCYVDADRSAAAVQSALTWRTKYLEAARKHRGNDREKATRNGLCRNCLSKPCAKGARTCPKCLVLQKQRREVAHVVRHTAPVSPALAEATVAKIQGIYGRNRVSLDNVMAVLRGEDAASNTAAYVARALRELGHEASANNKTPGRRGGGRNTNADTELGVLLAVKANFDGMTRAVFSAWLDAQIEERRKRSEAA